MTTTVVGSRKAAASYRMLTAGRRGLAAAADGCGWCARRPGPCGCSQWCGRSDCRAVDGFHDPGGADSGS